MSAEAPAEFETIAELFRPLTGGDPGARDLLDDVALLTPRSGQDIVLTTDAIVEGVHFLHGDPLDLVARKLLRVNLSDLAAKGAEPFAYLLTTAWPRGLGRLEKRAFAAGLGEDQAAFGIRLLGGDTVSTSGPLTFSVTAMGWAPHGRTPSRAGARPGDVVLVSGFIGDGWLGLKAARGELRSMEPARQEALVRHYRLPEPRLNLGKLVREAATASLDVSDGLIADLGHIAEASRVAVALELSRIPHSRAAKAWLDSRADAVAARVDLATGGDDYEIAFTVRPEHVDLVQKAAEKAGTPVVAIGLVEEGEGVRVLWEGEQIAVGRTGWQHG